MTPNREVRAIEELIEHVKTRDLVGWGGHCLIECSCGWKTETRVIGEADLQWQKHLASALRSLASQQKGEGTDA